MKSRSIVFLILVIVLTAFIFSNSMQDAQTSSGQSGLFVALLEQFMGIFGAAVPQDAAVTIVRKGAHVAEFFLLGLCWGGVFLAQGARFLGKVIYVLFAGLLTACCDELIQMFSDGRGSMVSDVFVDFSGVILAALLCLLIARLRDRKRGRRHGSIH